MVNRWVVATLIAAAMILAAVLCDRRERGADDFYAQALGTAGISQQVYASGAAFDVTRGVVYKNGALVHGKDTALPLRIAYAKTLAERRPLLALPGIDRVVFADAIERLFLTQQRLADAQTTSIDRVLVARHLYPIDFLEVVSELEQARRDFIAHASLDTLSIYQSREKIALRTYESTLNDFMHAFDKAVPSDAPNYATQTNLVSRDRTVETLQHLVSAARTMAQRSRERTRCLNGLIARCDESELMLPALDNPVMPARTVKAIGGDEVIETLQRAGIGFNETPRIRLSSSACIPDSGAPLTYALERMRRSGSDLTYASPLFVGDITLIDSSGYGNLPFYSYFTSRGARFVPLRDLTYYACISADIDQGSVLAVEHVRRIARDFTISRFASGESAQKLSTIERLLANSDEVTEADATRYMEAVQPLLDAVVLPKDIKAELLDAWLEMHTHSLGTLQVLRDVIVFEQTDLDLAQQDIEFDFGPRYLFYVRSAFIPLLMANNPTAIAPHEPFFARNKLDGSAQPFRYYNALSRQEQSAAERDIALYYETHTTYVREE